ncbi:flavin reductase family protein [Polluticaenibacter yanchengensis]|uniref:Iron-sulfur cluster-binding domain-containing protein n=1 Tax=Polluticaenibacter yanchengensis TaxID=3014562 RepID=A0ABT4UEF3_9BACT|nr:iron-sulfur cluster-binding domain-containing protein [Chitinophagaceae bacterium LY-5]
MNELIEYRITDIKTETNNTRTFFLKPCTIHYSYKAGQFITFEFDFKINKVNRSYSISSSPDTDQQISITVKRVLNGEVTNWLFTKAKIGDVLSGSPAQGKFTIDYTPGNKRDIFLIAAGSGITALYSILKSVLKHEPGSNVVLVYSNSSIETTIFYNDIKVLGIQHPNLTIEWLFSDNPNILRARLGNFILEEIMNRHLKYDKNNALIYTCGPEDFMLMVQISSLTNGYNKNNIRKEIYDVTPAEVEKKYWDEQNRQVTFIKNNIATKIEVPYNVSLLDAALNNGISISNSCKAGKCGTCVCRLKQGKVWMHYNEVLMDSEIENGEILTCTGHPITDDVIIEIK